MEKSAFACERCGYSTNLKSNLKLHLKRIKPCNPTQRDISTEALLSALEDKPSSLECEYCHKVLSNRYSKYRHKQTCKTKNDVSALQQRVKELEAQLKASKITINNTTNNTTNNTINITLNTFGYENYDYVDDEVYKDCLKERTVVNLLEFLHFHPRHPENHNLRIRNVTL